MRGSPIRTRRRASRRAPSHRPMGKDRWPRRSRSSWSSPSGSGRWTRTMWSRGSSSTTCSRCGEKYRRIPLRGRCLACGGNLTLTVHESSVKKYLEISKRISAQFEVSNYLRQRIELIEDAITSLFTNDKTQDLKLDDFF